jgi:hypothetical protein
MNCFSQNVMGLSKFPDTRQQGILHFGSDIGVESLCALRILCSAASAAVSPFAF